MARKQQTGPETKKRRASARADSPKPGATAPARASAAAAPRITPPAAGGLRTPFSLKDSEVERALRTGEQAGPLEDLFGVAAQAELRALAREAETASLRGGDRVLILPGIMGSKLGYAGAIGPFDDAIWVDPLDIAAGRLAELRLAGGNPGEVQALGVMLFAYLSLKLRLRIAGHAAEFFAYDWRLGLAALGQRLRAELGQDGRRTHLVCHSMGGLVARALLRAGAPGNLGRIVTLGTPHNGSYSPVQAFRGVHSIVRKVAAIDLAHDQAGLADVFGTFPGLLEMMPSPRHRPEDFFDPATWPQQGPRPADAMLRAAGEAQAELPPLDDAGLLPPLPGLDGPRAVLVVGSGSETVVAARRRAGEGGDEFVYYLSTEGDGTVPLDLAVVPGLPTYVTPAEHGGMPNDSDIARAVDNILSTGATRVLPRLEESRAVAQRRPVPQLAPAPGGGRGGARGRR